MTAKLNFAFYAPQAVDEALERLKSQLEGLYLKKSECEAELPAVEKDAQSAYDSAMRRLCACFAFLAAKDERRGAAMLSSHAEKEPFELCRFDLSPEYSAPQAAKINEYNLAVAEHERAVKRLEDKKAELLRLDGELRAVRQRVLALSNARDRRGEGRYD